MTYNFRNDSVILMGDTHSLDTTYNLLNVRIPNGNDVIHMGDAALGFGDIKYSIDNTLSWLDRYNKLCRTLDINLYIIRGNHDATYKRIWDSKFSNVFLIKDYAYGIFPNNKKVLLVGGAVSVDRCHRKENSDYWSDETTPIIENIDECDFMFSHDAPEYFNHSTSSLGKHYSREVERDDLLIEDCLKQRNNISDILERSEAKAIYSGHFHNALREERHGIYYRCLDINELFEFDSTKEHKL